MCCMYSRKIKGKYLYIYIKQRVKGSKLENVLHVVQEENQKKNKNGERHKSSKIDNLKNMFHTIKENITIKKEGEGL